MITQLIWLDIALLSIGNILLGRAIAAWHSGRRFHRVVVAFIPAGVFWTPGLWMLVWLQNRYGFHLTLGNAILLSLAFIVSFAFHRAWWGPREPWDQYLNRQIHTILRICDRHGWKITDQESASMIARTAGFTFDQLDFQTLSTMWDKRVFQITQAKLPHNANGDLDYNQACATLIVEVARSVPRIMETVSADYPLEEVDMEGLRRLQCLSFALEEQRRP